METKNKICVIQALAGVFLLGLFPLSSQAEEAAPVANAAGKPDEAPPKKIWDSSLTAGLTLCKGNSDTLLGTLQIDGVRKQDKNEIDIGANLTYGENQGVKNNDLYRAHIQYNRAFTERFYGSMRVEGMRDGIADIKHRVVISPGVGYYFIKSASGFLRGETGPGYIFERRGHEDRNYTIFRIAERGEWILSKTAKTWEYVEILPQVDRSSNVIVNSEVGIEVAINTSLSLRSYIQDTFNNEPAKDRKQNDLKLVTGIAYKF